MTENNRPARDNRPAARARRVLRSEGLAATVFLALTGVFVAVLGASGWWTLETHRKMLEESRARQVEVVARLLADNAETAMAGGGVSTLRRIVTDAALEHRLSSCRLAFADGRVLADGNPRAVKDASVPETWPQRSVPAEGSKNIADGVVAVRVPIEVPGKGSLDLTVEAGIAYPLWAETEAQLGIGVISFAGLVGLLVVHRFLRRRLRAMSAISAALLDSGPDAPAGALLLGEVLGPEAHPWNRIIEDRDAWRRRFALEQAASSAPGARQAAGGEGAAALDSLWQGVLLLDPDGKVRYCNGAAAVFLRARRDEIIGGPLVRWLGDSPEVRAMLESPQRTRQRGTVEVEKRDGAGEKSVLRIGLRPMRREDGGSAVVVIEDVTQQRTADESRNSFVAQATHELRTPLTNIRLYVDELIENGDQDPSERARCINVIGQEARRLERIVSDMLSVSEIEAGSLKLRTCDVRTDALFEELRENFAAQAREKRIELAFDLPPKLPVLSGDRDKIMLALHNLVGNALKYTPEGGRVGVRAEEQDGCFRVHVSDTGIGIKPEEHELIFERFYRAKDKRLAGITGSGLGLALARHVVRMHGGDITLKSDIDRGSTFTLSVPASTPLARAA